jgi:hypothetical protein
MQDTPDRRADHGKQLTHRFGARCLAEDSSYKPLVAGAPLLFKVTFLRTIAARIQSGLPTFNPANSSYLRKSCQPFVAQGSKSRLKRNNGGGCQTAGLS